MRSLLLVLTCLIATTAAQAADRLDGLEYADDQCRSEASFDGQMTCVVYFSGQCPTARAWMGSQVKEVHDWMEAKHVNATLVLVTPDVAATDLAALDEDRGYHMVHALYAHDPANLENISLENIFQVRLRSATGAWVNVTPRPLLSSLRERIAMLAGSGSPGQPEGMPQPGGAPESSSAASDPAAAPAQGAATGHYKIDPTGLTDADVVELWWGAERCRPGANKNLLALAKRAHDGAQIKTLADRVTAYYTAQETVACAGPTTIQTLETLEALVAAGDGLPLKAAHQQGYALMHAPELKMELRARMAYHECVSMLRSPRGSDRENGREQLAELVQGAPSTLYGQKAAELQRALPATTHDGN